MHDIKLDIKQETPSSPSLDALITQRVDELVDEITQPLQTAFPHLSRYDQEHLRHDTEYQKKLTGQLIQKIEELNRERKTASFNPSESLKLGKDILLQRSGKTKGDIRGPGMNELIVWDKLSNNTLFTEGEKIFLIRLTWTACLRLKHAKNLLSYLQWAGKHENFNSDFYEAFHSIVTEELRSLEESEKSVEESYKLVLKRIQGLLKSSLLRFYQSEVSKSLINLIKGQITQAVSMKSDCFERIHAILARYFGRKSTEGFNFEEISEQEEKEAIERHAESAAVNNEMDFFNGKSRVPASEEAIQAATKKRYQEFVDTYRKAKWHKWIALKNNDIQLEFGSLDLRDSLEPLKKFIEKYKFDVDYQRLLVEIIYRQQNLEEDFKEICAVISKDEKQVLSESKKWVSKHILDFSTNYSIIKTFINIKEDLIQKPEKEQKEITQLIFSQTERLFCGYLTTFKLRSDIDDEKAQNFLIGPLASTKKISRNQPDYRLIADNKEPINALLKELCKKNYQPTPKLKKDPKTKEEKEEPSSYANIYFYCKHHLELWVESFNPGSAAIPPMPPPSEIPKPLVVLPPTPSAPPASEAPLTKPSALIPPSAPMASLEDEPPVPSAPLGKQENAPTTPLLEAVEPGTEEPEGSTLEPGAAPSTSDLQKLTITRLSISTKVKPEKVIVFS
jgi:hypothetical protein